MIRNYLTIAIRNILRNKGYFAITTAGLVIGMVCFVLLTLWVVDEVSYDKFHDNLDRLAVVSWHNALATGQQTVAATQAPLAPLLKESIPGVEDYIRLVDRGHTLSSGEESHGESILFADSSILTVLSFSMLIGDPASALRSPRTVVLTESAAAKYFGDEDPMGKTMTLNGDISVMVTGVVKRIPPSSSIRFGVLAPFDLLEEVGEDPRKWAGSDYFTLLLMSPGISGAEVNERVSSFCHDFYNERYGSENNFTQYHTFPFPELRLYGVDGSSGSIGRVLVVSIIALCLLFVSGMNFVMLTTARVNHRSREAGIRKVMGASQGQIVRQVLVETTMVSLLAMFIALLIVELVLPAFNGFVQKNLQVGSFVIELGGMLLLWVTVTGLLAGMFPAVSMASTLPAGTVRGQHVTGRTDRRLRQTLVVAQFTISVAFLLLAALMHQQLNYIVTKDIGLDKENVVRLPATTDVEKSYDFFKRRLLEHPGILAVTTSGQNVVHINSTIGNNWDFDGRDPATRIALHFDWVGYDYDRVLDIKMAQGRFYSEEYATDASDGIVLNEEAVQLMGIDDPIGKRFSYWGRDRTIIGVVKNFHLEPLDETIKPLILILEPMISSIYIKIAPTNQGETIAAIETAFREVSPTGSFAYSFLENRFINAQSGLLRMLGIVDLAALLVAFIAGLGLFGLISFLAERRRKEVGIRKTLGATVPGIMRLFLSEFMRLVAISLVIGCPLAYYLGNDWLSTLPYRTEIGWGLFAATSLLAATVVLLSVGMQVTRAARANPVEALKYE
ncbi:MAG: hypothetical protein DRP45_03125 [Candidatus Zixiibacteriota bacterium]|nr:MAG: hypothetical protein DRP45_03125 [candidate division Zixibacteria bacterium]